MTNKKTEEIEEAFCQAIVKDPTGNATAAYRVTHPDSKASNEALWVEASRMMARPNVILRIQEIREALAKRNEVTVDSISKQLEDTIKLATAAEQYSPAITGIMGKAKLHGHLIEKQQITGKDGKDLNLVDLSLLNAVLSDEAKKQYGIKED